MFLEDLRARIKKILSKHIETGKIVKPSEALYRKLMETANDAIFLADAKTGIIIEVNKKGEELLGRPSEDIVGMHQTQLHPIEEINCYRKIFEEHIRSGNAISEELYIVNSNGNRISVTVSANVIEYGNQRIIQGIFRDSTSRKKAEEKIRKLTHAVENSSATVVITDTKGRIEYANPKFSQLTGYSIKEALGKTPSILKSGKTPLKVYKELWQNITSDKEWRGEFCNRKKSGELYWESALISPVKDNNGVITNFIAIKDDITEHKKTENALKKSDEELRDSERKIRAWLENSPVCTKVVDLDFNLKYMSAAGIKALKIDDVTKLYGKPYPFGFFPESFKKSMTKSLEKVKETGEVITGEAPVCDIEGNELWFQATLVPVKDDKGKIDFIIIVSVDINERKKTEQALMQSEKLKSIGTLTSGISHEFNNILAIISGNVQLLEGTYKKHGDLTDRLRIIKSAIDDGAGISRKMLEFTKTSQDAKELVSSDIGDLIMQAIDFTMPRWKNEAQARGIDYKMDTEGMERVSSILCNPTELREVFINLIINALDAMPEGGSLSFSTWSGDDTIFVSISDTGEGMSEKVRKYIFDPFFTTKSPIGTGLGMSISYGIITRHGGKIEVESEQGKGTIFSLQFPIAAKVGNTEQFSEPAQNIQCKSLHILVVDDEVNIGKLLDDLLSNDGHKVKTVDNGADAIKLSKRESFDLVLCDLLMPDVSGFDVIKALNKLDRRPKIGIITGWVEALNLLEKKNMNVDFIVSKPFDFSDLANHINEIFGTNSR